MAAVAAMIGLLIRRFKRAAHSVTSVVLLARTVGRGTILKMWKR